MTQHGRQSLSQLRTGVFELVPVRQCQLTELRLAGRRQSHPHFAPILGAHSSGDRTRLLQSVDQFQSAVRLNVQARSKFTDGRLYAFWKSVNRQQQLVLLRFETVLFSIPFTEEKKLPDLAAKLGQVAVLFGG